MELTAHRVLDLTGERGSFAGFMLAHFGADVVLAEDGAGPRRRDARFDAYNRGKRSVTVTNLDDVRRLAAAADVVIDDRSLRFGGSPIDLAELRASDPALVTVSLTPFGSTGPKADWLATDLTLVASSGQMAATGDGDRPPVRISVPQAWCHAGAQAAVGTLIALEDRRQTGLGQHVDVSAQQATAESALPAILHAPAGISPVERVAGGIKFGSQLLKMVFEAADGWVIVTISFGQMIGPKVAQFMQWVYDEGFCDEEIRDKDYVDFAIDIMEGRETLDELRRVQDCVGAFVKTKTKAELLERGLAEGWLIAPVSDLHDVLDSPQLAARDYWLEVNGEKHPGPMVKADGAPLAEMRPAPNAGEHTGEVRDDWQGSSTGPGRAAPSMAAAGEGGRLVRSEVRRPLEGIKVCDLAWVAAAPLTTKILAHWGAEVIRVESVNRPCLLRQALGHRDDVVDQENAITWHSVNANKKCISLDLAKAEARQVVKDLVSWADIVLESFTPGTMARWGLGYDELSAINPGLVMASSCVMGQTGPYRDFAGFGNMSASVAGFFDITGWPDRLPAGPYMAYTDYTSPRFTAAALLAALDHRRNTGLGLYLDFSQMEAATHFLTPALLELQRTGVAATRCGNEDPAYCPHSVYATHGDDQWIAIVCETDEQWQSLAFEMRRLDLADLTFSERKDRESEIDEAISAWTKKQIAAGLQLRLQAHGVPAHQVQNSGECFNDPQLVHRDHFQWAPHDKVRRAVVDAMPYSLSRSSGGFDWAGPTYGEHTMEILMETLGYDGDRIAELAVAEALE